MDTTGAPPADTGAPTSADLTTTGAPPAPADAWERVADLAGELHRDPRRIREFVTRNVSNGDCRRLARPGGGAAELWVSAAAATALRARFAPPAPPPADTGEHGRTGADGTGAPPAPAGGGEAAWRELVAELREERDRLRSELQQAHVALQQARQHAEEAERGRHHAAEALATLRAHVAVWYAGLVRPWWRLRALPPLPPAVTSSAPALPKPEG